MDSRLKVGKIVFDICMQGGAHVYPYICVRSHMKVSRRRTQDDCNCAGQVSVMNVWICECKSGCWLRAARLR